MSIIFVSGKLLWTKSPNIFLVSGVAFFENTNDQQTSKIFCVDCFFRSYGILKSAIISFSTLERLVPNLYDWQIINLAFSEISFNNLTLLELDFLETFITLIKPILNKKYCSLYRTDPTTGITSILESSKKATLDA